MNAEIKTMVFLPFLFALIAANMEGLGQDSQIEALSILEGMEHYLAEDAGNDESPLLVEELQMLLVDPACINSDEAAMLVVTGLISQIQYHKLREYRYRFGDLLSLNELQVIEGWDKAAMARVMPFITLAFSGNGEIIRVSHRPGFHHELVLGAGRMVEQAAGYLRDDSLSEAYRGTSWRFRLRYDARLGSHLLAGFRMEKDPGEEFLPYHPEYLIKMNFPDYYSGYLVVKDLKFIRHICLGDYRIGFGKGLTLSAGSGFSSWKNPFGSGSDGTRFKHNSSMSESGFLRGLAVSSLISHVTVDLFFSKVRLDPLGLESDSSGLISFSSFSASGSHRTEKECDARGLVAETTYGCLANYRSEWFSAGIVSVMSRLSIDRESSGRTYAKFEYAGKDHLAFGANAQAYAGKSYLYAEASWRPGGKASIVAELQSVLTPAARFSLNFRHFPTGFQAGFHTAGAGPYGSQASETGLSIGLQLGFAGGWQSILVIDAARNPWIRYQVNSTGRRYAVFSNITRHYKQMDFSLAYTYRQWDQNLTGDFAYVSMARPATKSQIEGQILFFHGNAFRLKSKITWQSVSECSGKITRGGIIQQELLYRMTMPDLKLTMGVILFNTDAYSNRIFVYEPDLLYNSGSQTLFEEGIRSYILLKLLIVKGIDISFKASRTWYSNRETVGSGLEEVSGDSKTEMKVQLCYRM